MPDSQNYNTRLRTNAQINPPRRLRQSPSPPPRHRQPKLNAKSSQPVQPYFPPSHALLHPDDAVNKTFLAIGRAMLSVDNRAITIKDLSHLSLDYGLLCQNASAASQAITTFIRNHLNRCRAEHAKPLLLSLALTGTPADDHLAPALHSRSGGTSSTLNVSDRTITSFRRGTIVWYLSEAAGASCPFHRAGISVEEFACSVNQGTKRKRDSRQFGPRKVSAQGPAMTTRNRASSHSSHDATSAVATRPRLRVKLTLKLKEPSRPLSPDSDNLSENNPESESDASEHFRSTPVEDEDDDSSVSDLESSIHVDDSSSVYSQDLPPYPILSRSIPSPSCTTPSTSVASPSVLCSDPFSPYAVGSTLCSSHFISSSFASFRSALSNPPRDRARSSSLPFSAASPPPDSEDEDEDYHNSMVGLRRGSVPLPLKKEEAEEEEVVFSKFDIIVPKYVPGSVHLATATKTWDGGETSFRREENSSEDVSTSLEVLPGFVAFEHEAGDVDVPVKDEPTLPRIKAELDDNQCCLPFWSSPGKGTRDDPVRIGDVEVLGPESVRSREWDIAWAAKEDCGDVMDVDTCASESWVIRPTAISSSSASAQLEFNSGSDEISPVVYPSRHCEPHVIATVIQGLPVFQTHVAQGVPLLRRIDNSYINITPLIDHLKIPLSTLVGRVGHPAPRISVSRVEGMLGGTWVPITVVREVLERLEGRVPATLVNMFLSEELDTLFPAAIKNLGTAKDQVPHGATIRDFNALAADDKNIDHPRNSLATLQAGSLAVVPDALPVVSHQSLRPLMYDVQASTMKDLGIRVEDVFVAADSPDVRLKSDSYEVHITPLRKSTGVPNAAPGSSFSFPRTSSIFCEGAPIPLDEQEERLFHSFVDFVGAGCASMSMSCTSSPLTTPPGSPLPLSTTTPTKHVSVSNSIPEKEITVTVTTSAHQKENEAAIPAKRRKREKVVTEPVRRSKRALAAKAGSTAPMTRSRGRSN